MSSKCVIDSMNALARSGVTALVLSLLGPVSLASAEEQPGSGEIAELECAEYRIAGPAEEPGKKQVRKARKLARRAARQCKRKRYGSCTRDYIRAYGQGGDPGYLRLLGDAYRDSDDLPAAICTYSYFLDTVPLPDPESVSEASGPGGDVAGDAAGEVPGDGETAGGSGGDASDDGDGEAGEADGEPDGSGSGDGSGAEPGRAAEIAEVRALVKALRARWVAARQKEAAIARALDKAGEVDCGKWQLEALVEKPARKAKKQAGKHAKAARRMAANRNARGAIDEFRKAYALDGRLSHLRGLGDAYQADEQWTAALCSYHAYLTTGGEDARRSPGDERAAREKLVAIQGELDRLEQERRRKAEAVQNAASAIDCEPWHLEVAEKKPSVRDQRKARTLSDEAFELCQQRLFRECAGAVTRAFEIDSDPRHITSLAWVYQQIGDRETDEAAICLYQQFLKVNTDPKLATGARKQLTSASLQYNDDRRKERELEEKQRQAEAEEKARREAEAEAAREKAAKEKVEKEKAQVSEELVEVKEVAEKVTKWVKVQGRSTKGTGQQYIGAGLGVAGAASLTAGVFYLYRAGQDSNALSQERPWSTHFDRLVKDGQRSNTMGISLTSAGVVAILAGAGVYYWGIRASQNVEVELEVPSGGGGAGAMLRLNGRF